MQQLPHCVHRVVRAVSESHAHFYFMHAIAKMCHKDPKISYRLTSSPTSPLSSRTLYLAFSPAMSLSPYFSIALSLCHTLFRPLSLALSSLPLYGSISPLYESISRTRTHTHTYTPTLYLNLKISFSHPPPHARVLAVALSLPSVISLPFHALPPSLPALALSRARFCLGL